MRGAASFEFVKDKRTIYGKHALIRSGPSMSLLFHVFNSVNEEVLRVVAMRENLDPLDVWNAYAIPALAKKMKMAISNRFMESLRRFLKIILLLSKKTIPIQVLPWG